MKLSLQKALNYGIERLVKANIEEAELDARIILQHVLEIDFAKLLLRKQEEIDLEQYEVYKELISERACRKPLQYVLCEQEFMGYRFLVNEATLIPRRETEELIELVLEMFKTRTKLECLDIGTGTGCIPIATCNLLLGCSFVAVDYSMAALRIAKENIENHQLDNRIKLIYSNIFQEVPREMKFDLIISNPPYIESGEIVNLSQEVKDFEPLMALDGGDDGLYFYNAIIQEALIYLKPNGVLMFEIGYNQKEKVWQLLEDYGYEEIQSKKDHSGNDRIIYGVLKISQYVNND